MACLFLLPLISSSFDLNPFIAACWNMEILDPTNDGEIQNREFYHINISKMTGNKYSGHVFHGDCPSNITDTSSHGNSLKEIEISMETDQSGTLSLVEPDNYVLTDFNFIDTYKEFLGAYGVFNETFTYSANLVNLATLHVTFFKSGSHDFKEAIFTVMSSPENDPWYWKYGKYLGIAGVFVVTFLALQCTGPLIKMLGGVEERKEAKEKKE